MSSCSAACSASRRCLWLILFFVWTVGTATATRAETIGKYGSGVVIGSDGTILTAAHVIKDCEDITVRSSSSSSSRGNVIARDDDVDLAVVRSELRPSFAAIRDGSVRAGDSVVALGYPYADILGDTPNLTTGTVSALVGIHDDPRFLRISAPIQPGNSGGPLLDESGHLIGIVDAELNALNIAKQSGSIPQNVNFAINTAVIRTFLDRKGIFYQTAQSGQKLSPADVGDIARPFTVQIQCRVKSVPNNYANSTQTPVEPPIQPPQQLSVLPACGSQPVVNVLKGIASKNFIELYGLYNGTAVELSGSMPDIKFCRALTYSSAGKRWINYNITWTDQMAHRFYVRVTWYSAPLW